MVNIIVPMKINGYFPDEAGGMDLITECFSNDFELVAQYAAEYEAQRIRILNEVVAYWKKQVIRMLINDVQYTIFDSYVQLEKELIAHIDANFA